MRIIRENIYDMKDTLDILYNSNLLKTNMKELKPTKQFNQNNFFIVEDYLNDYNKHLKDIEREYKNCKNIKCFKLELKAVDLGINLTEYDELKNNYPLQNQYEYLQAQIKNATQNRATLY